MDNFHVLHSSVTTKQSIMYFPSIGCFGIRGYQQDMVQNSIYCSKFTSKTVYNSSYQTKSRASAYDGWMLTTFYLPREMENEIDLKHNMPFRVVGEHHLYCWYHIPSQRWSSFRAFRFQKSLVFLCDNWYSVNNSKTTGFGKGSWATMFGSFIIR